MRKFRLKVFFSHKVRNLWTSLEEVKVKFCLILFWSNSEPCWNTWGFRGRRCGGRNRSLEEVVEPLQSAGVLQLWSSQFKPWNTWKAVQVQKLWICSIWSSAFPGSGCCISTLGCLGRISADKHVGDTFSSDISLFNFLVVQIENYSREAFHLQQTSVSWQKIETLQAALPGFSKRRGRSADSTWMLAVFCCCLGAWKLLAFFSSTLPHALNKKMLSCHTETQLFVVSILILWRKMV